MPRFRKQVVAGDEVGAALDELEELERAALARAEENVREALAALRPFDEHRARMLPGITTAVDDVRAVLETAASHLGTIVTMHLDVPGEPALPEPEERVDHELAARVMAHPDRPMGVVPPEERAKLFLGGPA